MVSNLNKQCIIAFELWQVAEADRNNIARVNTSGKTMFRNECYECSTVQFLILTIGPDETILSMAEGHEDAANTDRDPQ